MKTFVCWCVCLFLVSCDLGYDPSASWARFDQQRKIAHQKLPQLNDKGELMEESQAEGVMLAKSPIDEDYELYCSSCHGVDGRGQTDVGRALKSRNLTDAQWQGSVSDERIYGVIKNGGTAYGLSGSMAAWGAILGEEKLQLMVKKVRSFKGK